MSPVGKHDPTRTASDETTTPRQTRPRLKCGNQAPYDREADTRKMAILLQLKKVPLH